MSQWVRNLTLLFFSTSLQRKPYQIFFFYWVNFFHVSWVGRCTGEPFIELKHLKKSDFHDKSPLKMYTIKINFQLWTPVYSVIIKIFFY